MEAPGGHLDSFRAASGNSSSRRYGMLSASNIIQAPLSALLEYSGLLRGRSNHQESESLINGRSAAAFRDHHRSQLDQSPTTSNDGEVSIRIIGAGEQEHDREGAGLVVGQLREVTVPPNEVSASPMAGVASVSLTTEEGQTDGRTDRSSGEGMPQSLNGSADGEGVDGAGSNGRDSSYQRYDIQQAARWIEQVLPFSLLLLVVFIRQHLQGFFVTIWIAAVMFKSNDILRKQTALKGERKVALSLSLPLASKAMATARVLTVANTSCLLSKTTSFLAKQGPYSTSLCFTRRRAASSLSSSSRRSFACTAIYNPEVQIKEEGQPETLDYRVFFVDRAGQKVSPWHDIPLQVGNGVFNFVVEIPKESSAKMELATDEPHTPIKQDTKKGKLRYYPYNINWNYGLLPQTWEDPSLANGEVEGAFGDNDPVDVVEIGESRRKIGEVLKVKPLAALAMIDEGELDWKIVAISLDDPKASLVNDIDDVEKHFPGTLTAIRDWFRDYKIPDGKPANKFGLGNKAANKDYALKVITETNESWAKLVKRSIPAGDLSLA